MNKETGAQVKGHVTGDWSDHRSLQSAGRYSGMGSSRSTPKAFFMILGFTIGVFVGFKGGFLGVLICGLLGAFLGYVILRVIGFILRPLAWGLRAMYRKVFSRPRAR